MCAYCWAVRYETNLITCSFTRGGKCTLGMKRYALRNAKSQHCFIFTESHRIKITKNNKDIFMQGNKMKIKRSINVHGDYQLTTIEYYKCLYDFSRFKSTVLIDRYIPAYRFQLLFKTTPTSIRMYFRYVWITASFRWILF